MRHATGRVAFVTNATLVERPEGLYSPLSSVRRQIILPSQILRMAGLNVHVISLGTWPPEQIAPILEKSDRIVFGAMLSEADTAAYRLALRACGTRRRVVFFLDGDAQALHRESASLVHAWLVSSQAAKERMAHGPAHVYRQPAESPRGAPRVPRRGARQRLALWLARRSRVGLDPWRLRLLWFGGTEASAAISAVLPQLRTLAARTPLVLECLTEGAIALSPEATPNFRVTIGQRLPETIAAALQECDAVILPASGGFVDALCAGRFVVAPSREEDEAFRQFGWVGDSVVEGLCWLLAHPRHALHRLVAGQRYVAEHHSIAALARFWMRVLAFPEAPDPAGLVERGRREYAAGNLQQAEEALTRALEANNAMPDVEQLLGNVHQDAGRLDRAISAYRKALRLDPDLAGVHNDLGTVYVSKGWHEEALECYQRAVALDPGNHVAHANLAQTLMKLGRRGEALPHVRAALRLRLRYLVRRTL